MLAACADHVPYGGPDLCSAELTLEIQRYPRRDIDLLLVISAAPTMTDDQEVVRAQLAHIGQVYDVDNHFRGMIHIGVVSSDLGAPGVEGCSDAGDGAQLRPTASGERFLAIEVLDDATLARSHGPLEELLPSLLPPATGCPVQQPLEAMRRVLADEVASNAGFLRQGARRVVVFVGDSDDASPGDPATFAASLPRTPEPWMRAAYAAPAPRIEAFLDAVPESLLGTLADLSLLALGWRPLGGYGPVCLPAETDLDDADGLQVDCVVEQRFDDAPWTTVPACASAGEARPCWRAGPEDVWCNLSVGAIHVDRPHASSPPGVLHTRARCQSVCELTAPPVAQR